jgi:hypothetical protein
MEHLRALAAKSLAATAPPPEDLAAIEEDELVNKLFEEQWARLQAHVSDPQKVKLTFWTNMPGDVPRRVAKRVKRRLDAIGLRPKWGVCECPSPCWYYGSLGVCPGAQVYIKPIGWM